MKITLKLYALLTDYLPPGASRHAVELTIDDPTTAQQIIDRINIPAELSHLVLLNGIYLEPQQRKDTILQDGDTLAIWPPVAGG